MFVTARWAMLCYLAQTTDSTDRKAEALRLLQWPSSDQRLRQGERSQVQGLPGTAQTTL